MRVEEGRLLQLLTNSAVFSVSALHGIGKHQLRNTRPLTTVLVGVILHVEMLLCVFLCLFPAVSGFVALPE